MKIVQTSLKIVAGSLIVLGGLATIGGMLVQTQFTNDQLPGLVERLTAQMNTRVTLDGVRGSVLSDVRIARITLSDRDGIWLDIRNLHLVWHPTVLFRAHGTLVDTLVASQIVMDRLPVTADADTPSKPQQHDDLPRWSELKRFLPRHIALPQIVFGEGVTKQAEQQLGLTTQRTDTDYTILLYTRAGASTVARLQVAMDSDKPDLNLVLKEEPGGAIGRILKLPDGTELMAALNVLPADDNLIIVKPLFVQVGAVTVYGTGQWQAGTQAIEAYADLTASDLGVVQGWVAEPLAGAVNAQLAVQGTLDEMQARLHVHSPGLVWADHVLSDLTGDADALFDARHRTPETATGQVDTKATLVLNDRTVALDAWIAAKRGTITADIRHAAYAPYAISGTGRYGLRDRDFAVDVKTDALNLRDIVPKTTLQGTVHSTLVAKGSLDAFDFDVANVMETNHGRSTLALTGTANPPDRTGTMRVDGQFAHDKRRFTLASQITADRSALALDVLTAHGPGLTLDGKGQWNYTDHLVDGRLTIDVPDLRPVGDLVGIALKGAIQMDADAKTSNKQQILHVTLNRLDLPVGQQAVRLQKPATLSVDKTEARLSPLMVSFSGGSLTAQGTATQQAIDATINARGLALHHLNDAVPQGRTDVSMRVTGTPKAPVVTMTGRSNVTHDDTPLRLAVSGTWRGRDLALRGRADARDASLAVQTNLDASLSLLPFATDIGAKTPLRGNVTAHMPMHALNPFLWAGGHRVDGVVDGKAALSGVVGQPVINGAFALKNGRYDHIDSGICLRRVNGVMRLSNDAIQLQNLTARDAEDHALAVNLRLALTGAKPFKGAVTMDRFRLFCGGLATGDIDGRIGASGTMDRMQLAGRLTLGPLNVQIPGAQTESDIPSVKVIRRKAGDTTVPPVVSLNIAVNAPNQIFVRGRGLDAEFGGQLMVTGFANQPVINGQFTSRRGRFTLLDRALKLNKAELRFAGAIPPSPFLVVDASTRVQTTEITVDLSGSAQKPALTLSSNPVRPQDEVLALLLFGRQLQNISPFQAIKLAQAARTLAGLDGGEPGILDKARNVLGLDALNIGTADDNSVTISTGKYVTDRVYVEVQEGARPEDKQIKTQIELTPAISGNTTIDGNANQGVGLGWRRDY